jgi:hypothetical protein
MITGKKRKFIPIDEVYPPVEGTHSSNDEKSASEKNAEIPPPPTPEKATSTLLHEHQKKRFGFNSNILYDYVRNPHKYEDLLLYQNDKCVIMKDAFPKAAIHLLLLPKESYFNKLSVQEFSPEDLDKVKVLHEIGRDYARKLSDDLEQTENKHELPASPTTRSTFVEELKRRKRLQEIGSFQLGYHVLPSLFPLHLHIITKDFISPFLKTKKHWNSFTSEFFFDIDRVEGLLTRGENMHKILDLNYYETLLQKPLECQLCKQSFPKIPSLKNHLLCHFKSKDKIEDGK